MKKLITGIILIFFVFLFTLNSYAASKPCFYIKDATKYSNTDQVTVELHVKNMDSKIANWSLDFKYDSSKLEYVSSKAGKDLNASFKLAENVPDESRVAMGAVSFTGFKKDGQYYSVTFKVKDDSANIPIELNVREVSDDEGNTIDFDSINGKIVISNSKNQEKNNKQEEKQDIKEFEKTDVEPLDTIEEIIVDNGNIEVSNTDELKYETENTNIVEVLDDGTMIPNEDGITNVKVKLNNNEIGNVEVEVKEGKISRVSGTENRKESIPETVIADENVIIEEAVVENEEEEYNNTNNTSKENNEKTENTENTKNTDENSVDKNYTAIIVVVIIIILSLIFFIIKKKRGGKK